MRESELDANGWLASLPPAEGYGLQDGPAEGYPLPTWREALLGEFEANLPLLVMAAAMLVTVLAFATGVIVTERVGSGATPAPASAPAACVQRADGQRVPAGCRKAGVMA